MIKKYSKSYLLFFLTLIILLSSCEGSAPAKIEKTPTPSTRSATPLPKLTGFGLYVAGNQLINEQGQPVLLHGVNDSGAEYSCVQNLEVLGLPTTQGHVRTLKSWNINVIRIPLNEDCWLGINGINPAYAGSNYQNALVDYVNLLNQNGLYVIVDLHWSTSGRTKATKQQPMPDKDHAPAFWTSVANTFKNNRAVIFDLFNEPFPDDNADDSLAAWNCVRDGGTCPGVAYTAAGFQTLMDAVRATGALNVVMVAGIGYSGSLSRWLQYKPTDPVNNLVASWHLYDTSWCTDQACWDNKIAPVAEQVPLVAGEIGERDCAHGFIDTLMTWLDQHNAGYLAWAWNSRNCSEEPSLLVDDNGTPSNYGIGFKNHLASLKAKSH